MEDAIQHLKEFMQEYVSQDNRATAFPYVVHVQDLVQYVSPIGMNNNEDVPYSKPLYEFKKFKDGEYYTLEEIDDVILGLREENAEDDAYEYEESEYQYSYKYVAVETFFTVKAANEWITANIHNLNKPRTFIQAGHRNFEMKDLFKSLEEITGIKLEYKYGD